MIAAWLLYGLAVGAMLAASAALLERALRLNGRPARGVWIIALTSTALLVVSGPQRVHAPMEPTMISMAEASTVAAAGPTSLPPSQRVQALLRGAFSVIAAPLHAAGEVLSRRSSHGANMTIAAVWALATAALLALFAWTLLRSASERRRWRREMLHGAPVLVAPETGPVVTGLLRPEIVVPEWLLEAGDEEQRLVLAHEREHLRARDPLLLSGGFLLLALLPWNPAAWWMLARLRLAVEVDCDRRVVTGGASRSAYGSVLLDVAGRRSAGLPGAPAFLESPAQLERRLIAMTNRTPRFGTLRSAALAAIAAPLVLAACETELPSAAEIEQMDVAAAEEQAGRVGITALGGAAGKYTFDGREISADEARRIDATLIASIEVTKDADDPGATPAIAIYSAEGLDARDDGASEAAAKRRDQVGGEVRRTATGTQIRVRGRAAIRGEGWLGETENASITGIDGVLLFIDGEAVEAAKLQSLEPDKIDRIEVLKGPAATRLYSDPRAENGVILLTTKKTPKGDS